MHSNIYCLPQKSGWMTVRDWSPERHRQLNRYKNQPTTHTIPRLNTAPERSRAKQLKFKDSPCAGTPFLTSEEPQLSARRFTFNAYQTHYMSEYGPHTVPLNSRSLPPTRHEDTTDPVTFPRRQYLPPMEWVYSDKGTPTNDPDLGRYEWRQFKSRPGANIWSGESMQRVPFYQHVGLRNTLPPIRLRGHDPDYEKQRWDTIKALDRNNALGYGFRKNIPGYTGHVAMVEHVSNQVEKDWTCSKDDTAMVSTTKATYKKLPCDLYEHGDIESQHKHRGPLSRMVSLSHPYNPFTQQSAYSDVGAQSTTSNK